MTYTIDSTELTTELYKLPGYNAAYTEQQLLEAIDRALVATTRAKWPSTKLRELTRRGVPPNVLSHSARSINPVLLDEILLLLEASPPLDTRALSARRVPIPKHQLSAREFVNILALISNDQRLARVVVDMLDELSTTIPKDIVQTESAKVVEFALCLPGHIDRSAVIEFFAELFYDSDADLNKTTRAGPKTWTKRLRRIHELAHRLQQNVGSLNLYQHIDYPVECIPWTTPDNDQLFIAAVLHCVLVAQGESASFQNSNDELWTEDIYRALEDTYVKLTTTQQEMLVVLLQTPNVSATDAVALAKALT